MKQQDIESINGWLNNDPPLKELCKEFPEEWQKVEHELAVAFSSGKPFDLQRYLEQRYMLLSTLSHNPTNKVSYDSKKQRALVSELVCYQMSRKTVQQHYVAIASGVASGKIRFNLFNGMIAQWLLFERDLIRKPVSLFLFKIFWSILWQKRFLMPLVQPKGIYCFYSRELITELKKIIGERSCLEIAAGDGTLSRFLTNQGVQTIATDDGSWSHAINYPQSIVKLDAKEALHRYKPQIVLCSWPPAANSFEKQVFVTRSVQKYIMIGSRHQFAAGNWEVYKNQTAFSFEEVPRLSRLVLPPELDAAVYIFNRRESV